MRTALLLILSFLTSSMAAAQVTDYVWVFLTTNPSRVELPKSVADSLQRAHMATIERLAAEGKLLAAGPFRGGGGMFVFRPTTIDSVRTWVASDPAVKAGRFLLEFLPYRPVVGGICKVGEGYVMTNYTSVRLTARWPVDGPALVRDALAAVTPEDTVIAAGWFGDRGAFLVYRNAVGTRGLSALPAVRDSSVILESKGLFIARGSFCEGP